jgi:hypothetical protein
MPARRYADEDKATALACLDANAGNKKRTARQLGIPRKTLAHWADGHVSARVAGLHERFRGDLADAFENVARTLLEHVQAHIGELIARASVLDIAISCGICVDKMLMLREGRSQ